MSIEALSKAASAAGFAMATPDEEPHDEAMDAHSGSAVVFIQSPATSNALVPVGAAMPSAYLAQLAAAVTWMRGCVPGFGGGQPA